MAGSRCPATDKITLLDRSPAVSEATPDERSSGKPKIDTQNMYVHALEHIYTRKCQSTGNKGLSVNIHEKGNSRTRTVRPNKLLLHMQH